MRLLDRYLLRELLIPLGYCLCGFLIFSIAFDLIGRLNFYQENQFQFNDLLELYLVKIPENLVLILPIVLLLALLYTLTNHARHHEITAMRAAGISLWRICVPYLLVGLLLSLALFAVNELWSPDSAGKEKEIVARRMDPNGKSKKLVGQVDLVFPNDRDQRYWSGRFNLETHVITAPQVRWNLADGSMRVLDADRAEYLNGAWTFFGSPLFKPHDITNAPALAARWKKPPRNDALSQYLNTQISPTTHYIIFNSTEQTNANLPKVLADDLNHIIQNGPIYDAKRFAGIKLSREATTMLKEDFRGTNLVWLNRILLFDAYPKEMNKGRSSDVSVRKVGAPAATAIMPKVDILLYTNLLIMPDFSETPDQFLREIDFQNRFQSFALSQNADIPIAYIRDYLRLRPELDAKKRWLLTTQLYGRFAAPWTCTVVVLIAIPFGAASGRRNIFVGVASSIVICFIYFVLLKLGLALGTGGYLPGWIAAWLPNATFGIAGIWMMLRVR
jgi:lipopolysaccharide export LptBFGC system permease protein LptF